MPINYFILIHPIYQEDGDRHPKVGRNVLIGANASILGNIKIGDGAKIGAGSVVLKPIPHMATAVGVPGKVIGWAKEEKPGSEVDVSLKSVDFVPINDSRPETPPPKAQSTDNNNEQLERKKAKLDCSLCPYQLISSNKNAVCSHTLAEILKNEGATEDEIGEVFLSLLHEDPSLGYIPIGLFRDKFASVAKKYTRIDSERLECIAKGDDERLPYLKDCSLKVKRLFSSLHQFRSSFENKVQKVQRVLIS